MEDFVEFALSLPGPCLIRFLEDAGDLKPIWGKG